MPEADLALLREIVSEASDIALTFSGPDAKRWDKDAGQGPVTEADLAVNAHLEKRLRPARPDYGWISEESPEDGQRFDQKRLFVVDPIDGTRSFIEGSGTWAISVAVVELGQPIAAVVALPARGKVFSAARGFGAHLDGLSIASAQRRDLTKADVLVPRPAMDACHWPGGVPDVNRHHRPSLAYRLCLAAQGRFDAMITLRNCWEWDIAAGSLIAQEAGCRVTDRLGQTLCFNSQKCQTSGVVVANPDLHSNIVNRLTATA